MLVSSQRTILQKKTDDYINIMSNYGYDLRKDYYLSAGIQFLSFSFSRDHNYSTTPEPVYNDRISKFMAPGYLNIGLSISLTRKGIFR